MALFPQPQPSSANNHHAALSSRLLHCCLQQTDYYIRVCALLNENKKNGWETESLAGIWTLLYDEVLNPRRGFRAGKWSKLPARQSHTSGASFLYEHEPNSERRVQGYLLHCKYFRASSEAVLGLSAPLENSGTVRRANANPSPVAPCLSVCRADNVDLFYLPSLLSCFLPFVSAV